MKQKQWVKLNSAPIRVYLKTTNIKKLSAICNKNEVSISGIINAAVQLGLKNTKAIIKDAKDAKAQAQLAAITEGNTEHA